MDHCRDSLNTYARPPLILYHPRPVLLNLPFTRPGPPFKLRLVRTHGFGNTSGKKMSVASRLILNWLIKTSIIVPHNHRPISYCFCHIHQPHSMVTSPRQSYLPKKESLVHENAYFLILDEWYAYQTSILN